MKEARVRSILRGFTYGSYETTDPDVGIPIACKILLMQFNCWLLV